jgi:predicted flap endonuclease-1-like 5' DNA nuclease
VEEVPVEPLVEEEPASPWAPPEEIFADEPPPEPQPQPVEEEVVEMEVLPDEEILEATIVEDEPIEAEVLGEETGETDLRRLRGVGPAEEQALRDAGVDGLASLAGHDPHDLASRTGLAADALASWLHVANLVQEVGVPIDSAVALVAAGVEGPRGLRDLDEQEILDRVEARGGLRLSGRDVKRWKRRA